MSEGLSRRRFLELAAKGFGAVVVSYGLMGCNDESLISGTFEHGVASGDPLNDSVILWTRVTPERDGDVTVNWVVATDSSFTNIVTNGNYVTTAERDYTVKVDAIGLSSNTTYYYRFFVGNEQSTVGVTKTLPTGDVSAVKLAVVSCSNYPAGFFNVYDMIAQNSDLDAVLHLGDYIYEYGRGEYASDNAQAIGREVLPSNELLSLSDYRTRYAQYRTDERLQKIHAQVPFITIWDDHEVANDAWKDGAENHNDGEGDYDSRKDYATQAYFEWIPIRPWSLGDHVDIYRSFSFGNLLDLHMLDTRLLARDIQLDYSDYMNADGSFDETALEAALTDETRTMMGETQFAWLTQQLTASSATWQVIGQQVLMGRMTLPAAVALQEMSIGDYATQGPLALLAQRVAAGDETLTADEISYVSENQSLLTEEVLALLALPSVPYNLDAWDGYAYERERLFSLLSSLGKNTVVVAGDTHNSWANNLRDEGGNAVAVEFATSSVTSPGMEDYLDISEDLASTYEAAVTDLVNDLQYTNLIDRGYLLLEITAERATSTWYFVDTILSTDYSEKSARRTIGYMVAGTPEVIMES